MNICKLSGDEWLNLALIRSLEAEYNPPLVLVTWASGDCAVYRDKDATLLLSAWAEVRDTLKNGGR